MVALVADATEDCLPLGLLGLRPFGGMVPSGKELTRSRMAILNPFNSLLRSSALIFDEAQTITANAALARSRGGNRSSAMAPTTLCIVAFTADIIPDSLSVATGPHHRSTGSESEQKSESRSRRFRAQRRHFTTTSPIDAGAAIATVMSASQAMR